MKKTNRDLELAVFTRRWVFDQGLGLMVIAPHINHPLRALRNA
jgi:hypothetical protein